MILWELILTESYAAQILKISVAKTSKLAMMNHANIVKIKILAIFRKFYLLYLIVGLIS